MLSSEMTILVTILVAWTFLLNFRNFFILYSRALGECMDVESGIFSGLIDYFQLPYY